MKENVGKTTIVKVLSGARKVRSNVADERPSLRENIARPGRGRGKTVEDKIPEDDEDDSEQENNEEGEENSDSVAYDEQEDEVGSELEEIDHVKLVREYTNLIKTARRLGDDLNVTYDFAEGNSIIIGNIESASRRPEVLDLILLTLLRPLLMPWLLKKRLALMSRDVAMCRRFLALKDTKVEDQEEPQQLLLLLEPNG